MSVELFDGLKISEVDGGDATCFPLSEAGLCFDIGSSAGPLWSSFDNVIQELASKRLLYVEISLRFCRSDAKRVV